MAVLDRQLLETGLALSHALSLDRVLVEGAQQIRRVAEAEAVAIALADATGAPRLAHQSGFEHDRQQLESALHPVWTAVADAARQGDGQTNPVVRETDQGTEITVPMVGGALRGAITVLVGQRENIERLEEIEQALAIVAPQVGVAVERARAVEHLLEKRRQETISEVVAGIAHELRNPLYGISSAAQLLRFRVREDPVVEKNVGRILRDTERLNAMVSALLEYAQPAAPRLERADPDAIWESVLGEHRGLLESKALAVRHLSPAPRAHCQLDTTQIAQAFAHVLDNAVDAAPEGSDLTLVSGVLPDGSWRCRLHNGGPTIAPDMLPRVFELFHSTKPGAAGIGLALSRRIVTEHGGTIEIESVPDVGTTVTIVLPSRAIHSA